MRNIVLVFGVILIILLTLCIVRHRDNYTIPKNCEKALVDNCFDFQCAGNGCPSCPAQPGVAAKLHQAGCTSDDINNWCNNRRTGTITLNDNLDPQTLLNNLRTAYESGDGVMITTESFAAWSGTPFIDGSASIVGKGKNVSLFGINWDVNFGYIWNPQDNIRVAQCTYPSNATSMQRTNKAGQIDRCAPDSRYSPHYPILCGNTAGGEVCIPGADAKCPNNKQDATYYLPCGKNGMCPTPLCNKGENCIDCMFRHSQVKNYNWSNSPGVSCPIPGDPQGESCGDNEVVFDRNRRNNVIYPVARDALKKRGAPEPSALMIAISNDKGWVAGKTTCVDLFPTGGAPDPGSVKGKPPVLEWLKSQFDCNTNVVITLCNQTFGVGGKITYKDIVFHSAFKLKDIQNKVCIATPH